MKFLKIGILILLIAFIGIQFIPKDLPENVTGSGNDLFSIETVPDDVAEILRNSCFDCHSHEVKYPWYSYVAPMAWLVESDVKDGLRHLNFSTWSDYTIRNKIGKLGEISDEVTQGKMPLPVYTIIHRSAKLNDEEVALIKQWTDDLTDRILTE